jgi:glycine cleavage system aminomethyltransferase T
MAAARAAHGDGQPLVLGNLSAQRDWGYAPEYVQAMWRMLQSEEPQDLILATGQSTSVRDFARAAYLAAQATGPDMKLVLLQVESPDAMATSYEPIYRGDRRIGYVTSGAYGHHVQQSLALAYIDSDSCQTHEPLTVTIIGQPRPARILQAPPYDPAGTRLRG